MLISLSFNRKIVPMKGISNKNKEATMIIEMYMLSKCCNSFQWNGLTGEQLFFAMVQKLTMLLIMQLLFVFTV